MEETSEVKDTVESPKKTKKKMSFITAIKIIFNIILFLAFVFVIGEAIIGFIDMQNINDNREPLWCLSQSKKENNDEIRTTCDLGLYRIVKVEEAKKTTLSLKPFFLSE